MNRLVLRVQVLVGALALVLFCQSATADCPYGRDPSGRCLDAPPFDQRRPEPQSVTVTSSPVGATVWIDGVVFPQVTPFKYPKKLEARAHLFEFKLETYETARLNPMIRANGAQTVSAGLVELGTIKVVLHAGVECDEVVIDGERSGTERRVPAGNHVVQCSRRGYRAFQKSVTIAPGKTLPVVIDKMDPERGSIKVATDLEGPKIKLWRLASAGPCAEPPREAIELEAPASRGDLDPGTYCLRVESHDTPSEARSVVLQPGASVELSWELFRPFEQRRLRFTRGELMQLAEECSKQQRAQSSFGSVAVGALQQASNADSGKRPVEAASPTASKQSDNVARTCLDAARAIEEVQESGNAYKFSDLGDLPEVAKKLYEAACEMQEGLACYILGLQPYGDSENAPSHFEDACKQGVENGCLAAQFKLASGVALPDPRAAIVYDVESLGSEEPEPSQPGTDKSGAFIDSELGASIGAKRSARLLTIGIFNGYFRADGSGIGGHIRLLAPGVVEHETLNVTTGSTSRGVQPLVSLIEADLRLYTGPIYLSVGVGGPVLTGFDPMVVSFFARSGLGIDVGNWGVAMGLRTMYIPSLLNSGPGIANDSYADSEFLLLPFVQVETSVEVFD